MTSKSLTLALASAVFGWLYVLLNFFNDPQVAYLWAYEHNSKPFVYRALLPWIAQGFMALGVPAYIIVPALVIISAVVFAFALRWGIEQFTPQTPRPELIALLLLVIFILIMSWDGTFYDMTTAALFTLAIIFIYRASWRNYIIVFTLATINRETSIYLIAIYAIYAFLNFLRFRQYGFILQSRFLARRLWQITAQVIIYVLIQFLIRWLYRDFPGSAYWNMLASNLRFYERHILIACLMYGGLLLSALFAIRHWRTKTKILQIAFCVMFPVTLILFPMIGKDTEVRLFSEVYSTTALLILQGAK